MYILLPLLLILIGAGIIGYVVYRKLPYLRKLTPESHEVHENVLYEYFPEIEALLDPAKAKEYKQNSLRELEKLIRRFRMITLKVDHISERVIKKIRHHHVTTHLERMALERQETADTPMVPTVTEPSIEDFKRKEQLLIIEIAKSPKDPALYNQLGDLYLEMNNPEEARESFEAALALNPNDQVVARKYSQLLKKAPESTI